MKAIDLIHILNEVKGIDKLKERKGLRTLKDKYKAKNKKKEIKNPKHSMFKQSK